MDDKIKSLEDYYKSIVPDKTPDNQVLFKSEPPLIKPHVYYSRKFVENKADERNARPFQLWRFGSDLVGLQSALLSTTRIAIRGDKKLIPVSLIVETKILFTNIMDKSRANQEATFSTEAKEGYIVNLASAERKVRGIIIDLIRKIDEYTDSGSGWVFNRIISFNVLFHKTTKPKGKSYIPLPQWIKQKLATINVKNDDNKCFMWAILSALIKIDKDPQRVNKYKEHVNLLNLDNIEFPVKLDDNIYKKFEKQNPSISLYVFYAEEESKMIYPVYKSSFPKRQHIVDLLLYEEHYVYIKDLEKLIATSLTKHKTKVYICRNCMLHFHDEQKLQGHESDCYRNGPQRVELPKENERFIEFNKFLNMQRHQFVVYADFESNIGSLLSKELKDTKQPADGTANNAANDQDSLPLKVPLGTDRETSFMIDEQKHTPNSFCLHLVSDLPDYNIEPIVVHAAADNIIDIFMEKLNEIYNRVKTKLLGVYPLTMTKEEEEAFKNTKV